MMSAIDHSPFPALDQPWHTYPVEKTLRILETSADDGLTSTSQQLRQAHYGINELQEGSKRSHWRILLDQFNNVMLLMLIGVAVVAGLFELVQLHSGNAAKSGVPFKDTIAILAIVVLNGLLGYFQESRAEKALAALKRLAAPQVQVIRDRTRLLVEASSLVPGDIFLLEAGTQLCADGQLIEAHNLQIREAALTGEAHAVMKESHLAGVPQATALGDRPNMIFAGTEVVQGRGKAVVTATGMATELGKIAQMLQDVTNEATPLQRRMSDLGNVLVSSSLTMVALVIAIGVLQRGWEILPQLVEVSLSMAVAVVPEGLPAVITVTLALGTQRMVKRNALIRKLPAVETLGSVNVICSDKTGTLTQNKMVVKEVQTAREQFTVTGEGYTPLGHFYDRQGERLAVETHADLRFLLLSALLCNDAHLYQAAEDWTIIGDPTEGALLALAGKGGLTSTALGQIFVRQGEIPFSSERKQMSVMICYQPSTPISIWAELLAESPYFLLTKGSPETLLPRCSSGLMNGKIQPLDPTGQQKILAENNHLAGRGLRVLGFAYKPLEQILNVGGELIQKYSSSDFVWLGFVGMLDAPRPEVKAAVAKCQGAGIRTIMITGDHPLTAAVIAQELGISTQNEAVMTGQQLDQLSQSQLEAEVERIGVFARVSPEHKLRIVQALQKCQKFVAMTGDGVNDAPALKQADIGIAMGITGTDVSKEASDMVLLDDNFATIVAATEEGRVVYSNIRHFIKYILGSNIGEVITIAASPLLGLSGVPLTPLQILWMNLVTDGLPALALAVEPGDPHIMRRQPYKLKESIFARGLGFYIIRIGLVFSIITITLMLWAYHDAAQSNHPDSWKTMVFTTLCIAQMGHAIAVRSNTRLTIEMNPLTNLYLWGAVIITIILQLMLIYVEPLRQFFNTDWLSPRQLLICLGFSSLMFLWVEMEKIVSRLYLYFLHRRNRHP